MKKETSHLEGRPCPEASPSERTVRTRRFASATRLLLALAVLGSGCGSTEGETKQAAAAASAAAKPGGDVVTRWNEAAVEIVETIRVPIPLQGYFLSLIHVCIFDAVNSITGDYTHYAVKHPAQAGASAEAAAAAAGHACLRDRLAPDGHGKVDAKYAELLATIPDGQSKKDGIAVGQAVATRILELRAGDKPNLDPKKAYTAPPTAPGVWVPTPSDNGKIPPYLPGHFAAFATFPPWTMTSPSQFRPEPPPSLTSAKWAEDLNEVKKIGSLNSTDRSADETHSAVWWSGSGILIWNAVCRTLSARNRYTLSQNARLFALMNMAAFDGNNATFDAKYTFFLWRPVTAIRQAESDGNPQTEPDPTWQPLLDTPPFPEYTSGHAGYTGAASAVLQYFFPDNNGFSMVTPTSPDKARTFDSLRSARAELINARVWAGVHYRFADTAGAIQGREIARQAVHKFLTSSSQTFDDKVIDQNW